MPASVYRQLRRFVQSGARVAFIAAAVLTLIMASLPHPPPLPGHPPDKIQHVLAFATLGLLGSYGFREITVARLFLALTMFGILIELIQAIPALNRTSEAADVLADMAAAIVALSLGRWAALRFGPPRAAND